VIEQDLQGIGLTDGETKAYLAMLESGSSTVGPIAKKSGISYSKIYEVLQRLIDKGIVSFIVKEKTRYFQAVNPSMLYRFLERQEDEIEKNKERLKKIIPELEKHTKIFDNKEEVELFIGLKGLRTANEKMYMNFHKKDVAMFLYVYREEYADMVDEFFLKLAPFYKKIGIRFKGLGTKKWVKSEYAKKTSSFIDARYVDFPLPGTIDIYKDTVLQVSWGKKPIGILMQSQEIADNYRNYFNEVWKIARK